MYSRSKYNKTYDTIQCTMTKYHPTEAPLLDDGIYFFIKRIEFYKNEADAKLGQNGTAVDLSSKKAAERTLFLDKDNTDGLFGKNEFDFSERALSLQRSESYGQYADYGSRVKFSLRMKNASVITPDHRYIVITYKTNIVSRTDKIRLMMENHWGNYITLDDDVSVSNGNYIKTNPINIHIFDNKRQDFLGRLCNQRSAATSYTNAVLIYLATAEGSGVHSHPYIELMYNAEGSATVFLHSQKHVISRGDILIVPPLCAHNVVPRASNSTLYSVRFMPEQLHIYGVPPSDMRRYISIWQENIRRSPRISASEMRRYGLDKLVDELISLLSNSSFAQQVKVHTKLLSIFSIMLDRCTLDNIDMESIAAPASQFDRAIDAAHKNLYSFTAADAAAICNLSYNYFCSNFKKAYGIPFSSYLDSLRLHESERLLLTTDMSITDIAMSVGFTDTSYYIKKFKAAYKTTPAKFRKDAHTDELRTPDENAGGM